MRIICKILSVIVLYNPDIDRLKKNVMSIVDQVDKLIFVDNGSSNYDMVNKLFPDVHTIRNDKNLGIAKAFCQAMEYAVKNNYDWVLTLDQDSVAMGGLINEYKKFMNLENVGILTCKKKDRNFNINRQNMNSVVEEVNSCISSGSFINVDAYKNCDGFDESLFIDWVDNDICYNMLCFGYKIYKINYVGLLTEIANSMNKSLFGRPLEISNYSSFRRYYRCRNEQIIKRRYPQYHYTYPFAINFICSSICIIFYEKNRYKKIKAILKGYVDFKKSYKVENDSRARHADKKNKAKMSDICY